MSDDLVDLQYQQAQRDLERLRGPACRDRVSLQAGRPIEERPQKATKIVKVDVKAMRGARGRPKR